MKAKTRKSADKRYKRTKHKIMMQKACRNHLLVNKSKKVKRQNRNEAPKTHARHILKLLPNG